MVCDRCKQVLQQEFQQAGIPVEYLELGEVRFGELHAKEQNVITEIITRNGFEIIADEGSHMVEQIKSLLIRAINENSLPDENISAFLSKRLHREYSALSKTFSSRQGLTIEKYFIRLKIEKAKELIQMGQLRFSEIAYSLQYNSSSHLASQFKAVTGLSMSAYKSLPNWNRNGLDQIV